MKTSRVQACNRRTLRYVVRTFSRAESTQDGLACGSLGQGMSFSCEVVSSLGELYVPL